MARRRMGSRPVRTYWTPDAVALIETYQVRHQIPSFSAAAETLVRLGLDQSPTEIITPIIASAVQQSVHRELERLVRLQIATALNTEMAWRFAAVTLRDLGRTMTDEHRKGDSGRDRYFRIKERITSDARQSLGRERLRALVQEFEPELAAQVVATTLAEALGLDALGPADVDLAGVPPIRDEPDSQ